MRRRWGVEDEGRRESEDSPTSRLSESDVVQTHIVGHVVLLVTDLIGVVETPITNVDEHSAHQEHEQEQATEPLPETLHFHLPRHKLPFFKQAHKP